MTVTATHQRGARIDERASHIAREVVEQAASDVDRRGRFPKEAVDALRDQRLLSIAVPTELGGEGAPLLEVVNAVRLISRACASTGLIYAMHLSQLACLVVHGKTDYFEDFIRHNVVDDQALVASATTEANVGGDLRSSHCAVVALGDCVHLDKTAPVISYGDYADAVLVTARSGPDAPANDQVLVLCHRAGLQLTPLGEWDTIGFRGTCSQGFQLSYDGPADAVLPVDYSTIAEQTMVPISHVLWGAVWLGLADTAVREARSKVQRAARANPGSTPQSALRLAELLVYYQQLQAIVLGAAQEVEAIGRDQEALGAMSLALRMNGLKTGASDLVFEIAHRSLGICGIDGYRENAASPMARIVRDSLGCSLMISNDRVLSHSAQMLLIAKDLS